MSHKDEIEKRAQIRDCLNAVARENKLQVRRPFCTETASTLIGSTPKQIRDAIARKELRPVLRAGSEGRVVHRITLDEMVDYQLRLQGVSCA